MTRRTVALHYQLVATYGAQAWIAVMAIAFVPVYIRYLGIEAYGLIGLFATLQGVLVILDLGMTPTVMREIARFTGGERDVEGVRDLLRSVELAAAAIAVTTMLGVWASAHWLAHSWFHAQSIPEVTVARALAIMGVVSALRFVEGIFRGAILGLQRQILYNAIAATMATLRGLGAIAVLARVSNTLDAYFAWQGLVSITTLSSFAAATYFTLPRGRRSGRFSWVVLKDIRRFAAGMLGISILAMLLTQVDKILLSRLLSLATLAHYMLATVIAVSLETIVAPLFQAVTPRLSRLHAERNEAEFITLYHAAAQLVTVTAGAAALVLISFPEQVLLAWTQDPALTTSVAPLLRLLALGYLLNILMWMPYQAQLAHRWTGLTLRMNIVAVVAIMPALLWAVPRYGAVSAAIAWVVLNAGYVLIGVHLMHRRVLPGEKWRWYLADVAVPLAASAVALAMLHAAFPTVGTARVTQILFLAAAGSVAVLASGLAAPAIRRRGRQVAVELVRRRAA